MKEFQKVTHTLRRRRRRRARRRHAVRTRNCRVPALAHSSSSISPSPSPSSSSSMMIFEASMQPPLLPRDPQTQSTMQFWNAIHLTKESETRHRSVAVEREMRSSSTPAVAAAPGSNESMDAHGFLMQAQGSADSVESANDVDVDMDFAEFDSIMREDPSGIPGFCTDLQPRMSEIEGAPPLETDASRPQEPYSPVIEDGVGDTSQENIASESQDSRIHSINIMASQAVNSPQRAYSEHLELSIDSKRPSQKDGSVLASDEKVSASSISNNRAKFSRESTNAVHTGSNLEYSRYAVDRHGSGAMSQSTATVRSIKQGSSAKVTVDLTDTDSEDEWEIDMGMHGVKVESKLLSSLETGQELGEAVPMYSSLKHEAGIHKQENMPLRPEVLRETGIVFSSYGSLSALSVSSCRQSGFSIPGKSSPSSSLAALGDSKDYHDFWPAPGMRSMSSHERLISENSSHEKGLKSIFLPPLAQQIGSACFQHDGRATSRGVLKSLDNILITEEAQLSTGLLAVPLLKHQRIALAWMEKKEKGAECAGGILADDQGLGKTVSTIALILKAKPPGHMPLAEVPKELNWEAATVDLDDDEDEQVPERKRLVQIGQDEIGCFLYKEQEEKKTIISRGRPSAGTLVVCPTSVVKQWTQELREKVSEAARLSVLVYHGSNRTKDPLELAKHDVVVTTYSIVSMEVPKQPLPDEKEIDDRNSAHYGLSYPTSVGKGKKTAEGAKKKRSRGKKGDSLDDPDAGPLGKVGWFRVILDEAQSIKNRRTQVARACWGLRAKRRWCLSGTPIQNAIDDLYSYFRFLKYDPYAAYKSFRSEIKDPIVRNPSVGYRKLQLVLQKVMLRRTKATMIDGEPIINLPEKIIELKQCEFSLDERAFYNNLEVQSRRQFQMYAAAGTVQRNYVNILWMLLRLRQACDHPLLVKDKYSGAVEQSSLESASRLSEQKRSHLLTVLESNQDMCSVCMDIPEEAVVALCTHVFCRQCISERLNHNDDTCCPHSKCQALLNPAVIYSLSALKNPSDNIEGVLQSRAPTDSDTNLRAFVPESSSKIQAVIDTLRALPRLQCSSKEADCTTCTIGDAVSEFGLCNQDVITTEKAIVFSQWTSMLDLLEVSLKKEGFCYRRLDGTMSVVARDRALSEFKALPEVTVIIMSLKAASLGLNMVAACHVLLVDVWWNPTTEDQAIDRAHRIGQTRKVLVSRFTVKNTIEDRILALQDRKRQIVASAFGEDVAADQRTRLTVEDMQYLFRI